MDPVSPPSGSGDRLSFLPCPVPRPKMRRDGWDPCGWRSDLTSVWPDVPAATSPGLKVRDQLDYVIWVSSAMEPLGFHGGSELESWRTRTHRAYAALVDSMAADFEPDQFTDDYQLQQAMNHLKGKPVEVAKPKADNVAKAAR